jgi:hypothetical protein
LGNEFFGMKGEKLSEEKPSKEKPSEEKLERKENPKPKPKTKPWRGDALSLGHTFAGPRIEAPGNVFVGAGAIEEGMLGALFGVRAPATLLLLLLLRGGSSQEGGGSTRLFVVL